ncbi:ATP-binding cassette domain-containing protein [Cohnella terricola]|uniref:ATP-binding cassette domain-containing protein n=1 Tax=Cohnella terricola TaxID=1289167 RepID=A0A559JCH5_9BACL|nr:ATP-binding cassette domain-containing protein [Cohnella terricola]TVX97582.1 ATP-binding cassette domain-containing protein [Cohnella terricola]
MSPHASMEPMLLDRVTVYGNSESGEHAARLKETSLSVAPGEWLTVVGVNGSGKSTLARLLAGLVPEAMEGIVRRGFAGEGACPIVLQQPKAQLFGETPREEMGFALEWRGIPASEMKSTAEEALHRVGLAPLADEPWERLSGGQQQLAAIAAATACAAPLLVLDEATSMLDEEHRDIVLRAVREIHGKGTSVVWVTQRLDEVGPEDRVVAIGEGWVIYDGGGREFMYGSAALPVSPCLRAGLRLPYLTELALELRRMGKLSDPLPMTEREWLENWGNVSHGNNNIAAK